MKPGEFETFRRPRLKFCSSRTAHAQSCAPSAFWVAPRMAVGRRSISWNRGVICPRKIPPMIYGLYLSAQGAQSQSTRLDVIANNLANASTTGFKRDLAIYQAHPPYDVEHGESDHGLEGWDDHAGGLTLAGVVTDHSNAALVKSGGTYDVALAGPGYFQVANDREQLLTRNGQFTVSQNGELVNDTGLRVLNESGGPIAIPPNAQNIQIAGD